MINGSVIEKKECPYCSGKGYFQLLLGGSKRATAATEQGRNQHRF